MKYLLEIEKFDNFLIDLNIKRLWLINKNLRVEKENDCFKKLKFQS